jgi:glutamate N-acetyltransferase/amino-acid N-acetyltransferase
VAVTWPLGVSSAGVASGIKSGGELDLGLLVTDRRAAWAGTFTRNAAAAACVHRNRGLLGRPARALVVNSGNANACTGAAGEAAVEATAAAAARTLGCAPQEVLVASTGLIGVPLDVGRLIDALPAAIESLSGDPEPFATSILTTDSSTKMARARAGDAEVLGVAKGAAMLAPNMATMLAFMATDAAGDPASLQQSLERAVEATFNRICVDACESTNDTVICLATERVPTEGGVLAEALGEVCASLAEQIARDAEGAARLVRVGIEGAPDQDAAVALGRAVASSALWRAAAHGADPNWGRILAALGSADRSLDPSGVSVAIGPELVFAHGEPVGSRSSARRALEADDVTVTCTVGEGSGRAEILSSDLSPDYVTLNAFATT